MGIFSEMNHSTIMAPMKKIKQQLVEYISKQQTNITNMNRQVELIQKNIKTSDIEIKKSAKSMQVIDQMLAIDFDEDGTPDVDQPAKDATE